MRILTIFCVVFGLHPSSYCYAQSSKKIIGTWKIDIEKSIDLMGTDQRVQFNELNKATQKQVETELNSQTYTFYSDNTFTINTSQGSSSGSWELASKKLILSFSGGQSTSNFVEQLNRNFMTLRIVSDSESKALFHRIILYSTLKK